MKKSQFHFVKAVIMKCAAALGYWSLLSRPKDKMSNFLTKLLVCLCESLCRCRWRWGGEKQRKDSCWKAYKKYTGWCCLLQHSFILDASTFREMFERRARDRRPNKCIDAENFLVLNGEKSSFLYKMWKNVGKTFKII